MTGHRLALVVALTSVLPAAAEETVRGIVYDPHGRVVAGADVRVSCAGRSSRAVTSDLGRFSVEYGNGSPCHLTVTREGFDPWRGAVPPESDSIAVTLALAPVRESVHVEAPPETARSFSPALSSVRMDAAAFEVLGPDSRLWLDVGLNAAGAFVGARRIHVDGMAAEAPPQSARIAAVVINGDPFSAEFGGASQNRIDIETKAPDRRWRFNADGPVLRRGGGDALMWRPTPRSRRRNGGLSGPVPGLPLTFFAQGGTYAATDFPTYLDARDEGTSLDAGTASSRITAWAIGTGFHRSGFSWQMAMNASEMRLTNGAVGGLTAPPAGIGTEASTRRLQSSWKVLSRGFAHRGGMLAASDTTRSVANSTAQGRTVFGGWNLSGNDALSGVEGATRLSARHIVEQSASARPWSAGAELSRTQMRDSWIANPLGRLHLDALDATHGTLVVQRGTPTAAATDTTAAMFVQRALVLRTRAIVRAGVRGDWQQGDGVLLSPRTTVAANVHGFLIASSAGLFVEPWSPAVLVEIAKRGSPGLQTWIVPHAPPATDLLSEGMSGGSLVLRAEPGLARRRDVVLQAGVTRRLRTFETGLEYKWTRGIALPGTTRVRTMAGLVDSLDSDRHLMRHQLHARAAVSAATLSVAAHYEFVHSRDDTDGALSLPARQDDVRGEWGPSTGLPGHHASIVASFALPGGVHALVSGAASSGPPYSIITGRDAEGLATFTDRGGATRNGFVGPSYRDVSFYASKRLHLPRMRGTAFHTGLRVENLFAWTNVIAFGRVARTTWLGQPLTALSGRRINVWMTVAR